MNLTVDFHRIWEYCFWRRKQMKDKFNESYPSENAFLTNPIASATEATGCALRIEKRDDRTVSLSAPVKGAKLPQNGTKKRR